MKLSAAILAVSCSLAYASRDLTNAEYASCGAPEQSGGSRPSTPSPKGPTPWSKFGSGTPAGADVKPPSAPDASSSKPGSGKDGMPGVTQGGPEPTFNKPGSAPETTLFLRQAEGVTCPSTQSPSCNRLSRAMSVDTGRSTYSEPTNVPKPISQVLEPPQSESKDGMPGRVLEIKQATAETYTYHVPAGTSTGTRYPQKPVQTRPRSQTIEFPLDPKYRRRYNKTKKEFRKTKKELLELKRDYQELKMRVQDGLDQHSSDDAVKAISQKHGYRNVSTFSAFRALFSTILLLNTAGYGEIDANGVSIPSHGYGVNGCHPIEKPSADSLLQWYECPKFAQDGTEDGTAPVAETDMR